MKLRIRYAKTGKVRWISQRDTARVWERALRRVDLPVVYSEGFSPRAKVSFGLALSVGHEGRAEYLDVTLAEGSTVDRPALVARLAGALPAGIEPQAVEVLDDRAPSLQQAVTVCSWILDVPVGIDEVRRRLVEVLAAEQLLLSRVRKGKASVDDLRPALRALEVAGATDGGGTRVLADLATQPRAVRPAEAVEALWPGLAATYVCRTHQWIEGDGARWEPIPLDATSLAHAEERAS